MQIDPGTATTIGAIATIIGAFIGFIGGLVVAGINFRQKNDELFFKALGYTDYHIVHELAHRARHGICFAGFVGWYKVELASVIGHLDQPVQCQLQSTASAFDTDLVVFDRHIHASGDIDG